MYRHLQRSHNMVLTRYSKTIVWLSAVLQTTSLVQTGYERWWSVGPKNHVEGITKAAEFFVAFVKGIMLVLSKPEIIALKYYGVFRIWVNPWIHVQNKAFTFKIKRHQKHNKIHSHQNMLKLVSYRIICSVTLFFS